VLSGNVPWADLSDEDLSFLTASHASHLSACVFFGFVFSQDGSSDEEVGQ
jgi:hypothetical protein